MGSMRNSCNVYLSDIYCMFLVFWLATLISAFFIEHLFFCNEFIPNHTEINSFEMLKDLIEE